MKVSMVSYRGDSVHIVFDTGNSLTLPVRIEYSRVFSKNYEITDDEFQEFSAISEIHTCTQKAIMSIARCSKSEKQLEIYLKKKKFSEQAITATLEFLRKKGFLDDEDYAIRFTSSLKKRKTVGIRYITAELIKKGISRTIIENVVKKYSQESDDDESRVYEAAVKKALSVKEKSKVKEKVWRFLVSRGFSEKTIRHVSDKLKKEGYFKV